MTAAWELPRRAVIGEREYDLNTDYRQVLQIVNQLEDPELPEYLRWWVAVELFYCQAIPARDRQEAMEYLAQFLSGGSQEVSGGKKLLDWEHDSALIVADINKTAGMEIRSLPYLHWWTFLAYFHAIGEGQLSTVVSIRDKLSRGKQLEAWEKEYYRAHRCQVELPKRYTQQELEQRRQLEQLLKGR